MPSVEKTSEDLPAGKLHLNGLKKNRDEIETAGSERYQSILNILQGYEEFLLNPAGIIISSNLEAVNITGYEEWEVIGKHISIFYTMIEQLQKKPESDLLKAESTGKFASSGLRVKKREIPFWAKIKIICLKNEFGNVRGYRVTIKDATHRAMYNLNMKSIRDEYLHLFNNAFIGIFKFRKEDSQVVMLNEMAEKVLGGKKTDHMPFSNFFQREKDFKRLMRKLEKDKRVEGFEFRLNTEATTDRWCSLSCRYFIVGGFIEGIVIDVTEKRKQIETLQKVNDELDSFIYHASHDLRSPLTTMIGLVNLIQVDNSSLEKTKSYCKLLTDRILHLDGLLRDLVAIAFNNKNPLNKENIPVPNLIKSILKEFEPHFPQVNVSLSINESAAFFSDTVRISTIFRNLISNSFKYHNKDSDKPASINIHVTIDHEEAKITIQDNGIGIRETYLDDIYKLFFRADSRGKGSGLGLYIVKAMVDKLHGKIAVESALGQGTKFSLTIPNLNKEK